MSVNRIEDFPLLSKALETKQKIVYLCGAGASVSLGAHELSWIKWILAGKDFLPSDDGAELDRRIGSRSSDELINAATYLLERLRSKGAYESFMDNTIGSLRPVNRTFSGALRTIFRTGDLITTTNYDLLIEESVNARYASYSTPADILSVIRGDSQNKVIHLHGVYDKDGGIDDIIADGPQYKDILANSGAQFIQNLISTHTIVIVGCGGTVDDPNLSGFMNFVVEKLGMKSVPYFYLMKNGGEIPDLPENAEPVFYGDDYDDLPAFLSDMALRRIKKRIGTEKLIAVDPYTVDTSGVSSFARMHFSNRFIEFVGRERELDELNGFLEQDSDFSSWSVVGEGGIGKSRLVLEWLRRIPSNWFGFFSRKLADEAENFKPFTDTVIVFDYIIGNVLDCAETVSAYLRSFKASGYKLRILFIERKNHSDDWLKKIKDSLDGRDRLSFDAGEYRGSLMVEALTKCDEIQYIINYLTVYLPLLQSNEFIRSCNSDIQNVSQAIGASFRSSVEPECYRPLYLAIFTEVWLEKEGDLSLSSSEELMAEYLSKEIKRWKTVLGDDGLVESYLRILAMACAIERFNISDVLGNNYLADDCKALTDYFDKISGKPGGKNEFPDLFAEMDELEEAGDGSSVIDVFFEPDAFKDTLGEDSAEFLRSLADDERLAFSAPYIKLNADPTEVFLQMLVSANAAGDEEIEQLEALRRSRLEKEKKLPGHAWIIEPVLPTIIREYIVSYVINERDMVFFTKLARANSVFGLHNFLSLALEDRCKDKKIRKMIVTPPDEALNYSEYYFSLLVRVDKVEDYKTVERALINSYPCFPKYELELWRRIACVLNGRGDVRQLYERGCGFVKYLESLKDKVTFRDETADVIKEFCVGMYNAEEIDELTSFLRETVAFDGYYPKTERFGSAFCECFCMLIKLKLYLEPKADITEEWTWLLRLLLGYEASRDIVAAAMEAAYRYFRFLIEKEDIEALCALENSLEALIKKNDCVEVAEIAALTAVNVFTLTVKLRHRTMIDEYEKIKRYYSKNPRSKRVRSAFITASREYYLELPKPKKVPEKLIKKAKKWSFQYPGEIEFPEGYFGLLLADLYYAQRNCATAEEKRIFSEMKKVAEMTDYSEYHEENGLQDAIRELRSQYGY